MQMLKKQTKGFILFSKAIFLKALVFLPLLVGLACVPKSNVKKATLNTCPKGQVLADGSCNPRLISTNHCGQGIPSNAQFCFNDQVDVPVDNLDPQFVLSCSHNRKCEFTCNEGFRFENSDCTFAEDKFITVWETTESNPTIELGLVPQAAYDFHVDWGDGSEDHIQSFDAQKRSHTYSDHGEHTVTITGELERWKTSEGGTEKQLIKVLGLGDMGWKNLEDAFRDCENLISFSGGNTAAVTNMAYMFYGAKSLASTDFATFNTSNVEDMQWMFFQTESLTALDLTSFNTIAVTDTSAMFAHMSRLENLNLGANFYTKLVTDMSFMFSGARVLPSLDFNIKFQTGSVINMRGMFSNADGLTSLVLSNFDTRLVQKMDRMFKGTDNLTDLDLSSFDTSAVNTDIGDMFENTNTNLRVKCQQKFFTDISCIEP